MPIPGEDAGKSGLLTGVKRMDKILIVDDAKINRMVLKEMLKDQYEILESEDGMEAIDVFRQYEGQIKVVLLDAVMPVSSGYDYLAEARSQGWLEKTPVIMISTDSDEAAVQRAYREGVTDFIERPFDRASVLSKVNAAKKT